MKLGNLIKVVLLIGLMNAGCSKPIENDTCTACLITCVEGVSYLRADSGVTVMYNQDGTIRKCKGEVTR